MTTVRRRLSAMLLVGLLGCSGAAPSVAADGALKVAETQYRTALAKFTANPKEPGAYGTLNEAFKQYKAEIKTRKESIAAKFRADVDAAKAVFDRVKAGTTSSAQRNEAAIARDAAIAAAAARRDADLRAIGPEPTLPPKPLNNAKPPAKSAKI